jgi:hypothetical protein
MVTMVTTFLRLSFRDTRDNNCFSIYGYHRPQPASLRIRDSKFGSVATERARRSLGSVGASNFGARRGLWSLPLVMGVVKGR